RIFYNDNSPMDRQKCQLCSTGQIDDMAHIWRCPAFEQERENLRASLTLKTRKWNLPFSEKILSAEDKECERLLKRADSILEKERRENTVFSPQHLNTLVHNFWRANKNKPNLPVRSFVSNIRNRAQVAATSGFRNIRLLSSELVHILVHS